MAIYPCDMHTHRYPDPQRSVYISYACNDLVQTQALRLCPRDFAQEVEIIGETLNMLDDDSQISTVCEKCGEPRSCGIYAKIFDLKSDAVQYAGDFCGPCAENILVLLSFAKGRPMRTR